ncbi:Protein FAR1-RELATED SEQUENCE 11 [Bienertia sinuspersici]
MLDFDLNEPPIEEDDREYDEPLIGQTFASHEEAFIFYNNYARRHGFVIRKDRSNTKNGKTIRRDILCHRGGNQRLKVFDPSKIQRNKDQQDVVRSFDIFPEEWHVTKFVKEHNHCMVSHEEMRFLPANRVITQDDEKQIFLYKEAGLSVRQIIRVMELQKNVKHGELPFLEKDIRNLFTRVKRILEVDDMKNLLDYMKSSKQENPLFQYAYTTFVDIMKKAPKTIITDQDPWMSEAIAVEMPSTKHSFCIWHITSKFSCWFVALLRDNYQKWCGDFYLLYKMTNPNEFEQNWPLMVGKYDLQDNKHIQGLYNIRFFWAPAYLRDHFFGGMVTTGRSESINAFIKRFVSSHVSLTEFVRQVDIGVEDINQAHIHLNLSASLTPTSLKTKSPLEEQVYGMFTPFAFKKFQQELTKATLYSIIQMEGDKFLVRYYEGEDKRSHTLFWNGSTLKCSCKNFEFWGILCRHILRVLFHNDCFKIPNSYLPLR